MNAISTVNDIRGSARFLVQQEMIEKAEDLLQIAAERFPESPELLIDYMKLAEHVGAWEEASRRCARILESAEKTPFLLARAAFYFRKQGKFAEADRVLREGQVIFPRELAMHVDFARNAEEANNWPEAVMRYEQVRALFPSSWYGIGRGAAALREMNRLDEAEVLLVDGQGRHPALEIMFIDHARIAEARRDWPEALLRFEEVVTRFPQSWFGYAGAFRVLRNMRRLEDAETILLAALDSLPDDARPLLELAMFLSRIAPEKRRLGIDGLNGLMEQYLQKSEPNPQLLEAKAHLARLSGDYPAYLAHLLDAQRRFPNQISIQKSIVIARELLLGQGQGQGQDDPEQWANGSDVTPKGAIPDRDARIKSILSHFESLGGGGETGGSVYGCEFGFIQRSFGIESLSLLRWSSMSAHDLTRGVQDGFDKAGQPDSTVIRALGGSDWGMVDTHYGIYCDHTHLDRTTVTQEAAKAMMCQRTTRLARKLIEDLEDADKIFVYRQCGPRLGEQEILALAAALNKWGDNTLLYVAHADADNPAFSVRRVHGGLILGFLDWFAPDRGCTEWNTEGWTTLCNRAYDVWKGRVSEAVKASMLRLAGGAHEVSD